MADTLQRLKAALADRYAVEREIGAGGMATVYLAEDLKLSRKVAVKVLRPELAAGGELGHYGFLVVERGFDKSTNRGRLRKSASGEKQCIPNAMWV